jgi:hypothetical protein
MHFHIGKHFNSGQIPGHAQFKVIVQEGKTVDIFLGMLSSRS